MLLQFSQERLKPFIKPTEIYSTIPMDEHYQIEKRDPNHHWAPALNECKAEFEKTLEGGEFTEEDFFLWVESNKPDLPKTRYLSVEEVENLQLLIMSTDEVVYKSNAEKIPEGMHMFVMTPDGEFYLHPKVKPVPGTLGFNHSSFFQGEPVAGVGFLHFDSNGKLIAIDNYSGHYKPEARNVLNALESLAAKGVDLNEIQYNHRISTDRFDKEIFNAKSWCEEKCSLKRSSCFS